MWREYSRRLVQSERILFFYNGGIATSSCRLWGQLWRGYIGFPWSCSFSFDDSRCCLETPLWDVPCSSCSCCNCSSPTWTSSWLADFYCIRSLTTGPASGRFYTYIHGHGGRFGYANPHRCWQAISMAPYPLSGIILWVRALCASCCLVYWALVVLFLTYSKWWSIPLVEVGMRGGGYPARSPCGAIYRHTHRPMYCCIRLCNALSTVKTGSRVPKISNSSLQSNNFMLLPILINILLGRNTHDYPGIGFVFGQPAPI